MRVSRRGRDDLDARQYSAACGDRSIGALEGAKELIQLARVPTPLVAFTRPSARPVAPEEEHHRTLPECVVGIVRSYGVKH